MKEELKLLREDRVIQLGIRLTFFLWLIGFFLLFFSWSRLPPQVPLFYSRPWGENQLASPTGLFLFPLLSLLILVLNFGLVLKTFKEEKFVGRILVGEGVVFIFLCLVALYRIIALVT